MIRLLPVSAANLHLYASSSAESEHITYSTHGSDDCIFFHDSTNFLEVNQKNKSDISRLITAGKRTISYENRSSKGSMTSVGGASVADTLRMDFLWDNHLVPAATEKVQIEHSSAVLIAHWYYLPLSLDILGKYSAEQAEITIMHCIRVPLSSLPAQTVIEEG